MYYIIENKTFYFKEKKLQMKDESRELIEQYKDMYQKLNEQSIFSLRTYGREIGVAQPTFYKNHERIGSTDKAK